MHFFYNHWTNPIGLCKNVSVRLRCVSLLLVAYLYQLFQSMHQELLQEEELGITGISKEQEGGGKTTKTAELSCRTAYRATREPGPS